jgi:DNA-binding transcriptional LysR family regulator
MMKRGRVIAKIGIMHKSGLTELEVVLAVARRQGFRAAAVELDMSTTAVSNAVANLEARLGARLFHRTTRSVSLTEAGHQFVDQIGPAVMQIQDAMAAVTERKAKLTGTLRINSSLGAALMVFQPIVLAFLRRHPGMTVDIVTEGRMVDIVAEGFDAGLRVSSRIPRDMIRVPISQDVPMTVVGSAALSRRAMALRVKGDYDHAIADYNEALRLNNGKASVLFYNRAIAWDAKGDADKAIGSSHQKAPFLRRHVHTSWPLASDRCCNPMLAPRLLRPEDVLDRRESVPGWAFSAEPAFLQSSEGCRRHEPANFDSSGPGSHRRWPLVSAALRS